MDDAAACDDQLSRTPPRGWAVILLSRFRRSSIVVNSFAFGIFLPFITEDLGLTPLQAGLLQAVWWVATAALTLPFGALFSRFRPVPLTLVSMTLVVPFVFLQGLAANFIALFAARLLLVVSNLISIPARTLLLQQWAARRDYATVNAVGLSQHSLLLAISISLSAVLIGAVGSWRTAYFIQGGLMVAQLIAWLLVAKERHAPVSGFQVRLRAPQRSPIAAIRAYPQAWLIGVTMFFLAATWTAMVTFLPTLLLQDKGISLTLGGPLLAFLYYSLVPFALSAGWISRKVPNRKLLLAVPAVCNVALGVAITVTPHPLLLMALITGLGLVWVASPVIELLPFEFPGIGPREVVVVAALINTVTGMGFAVGPVVVGAVAEYTGSLQTGLLVLTLLTGVGVISALLYPSHFRDPATPEPAGQRG